MTKEEKHAKLIVDGTNNIHITLDNDCYAFYINPMTDDPDDLENYGGWDYDVHPDKLLRALLQQLNVVCEDC